MQVFALAAPWLKGPVDGRHPRIRFSSYKRAVFRLKADTPTCVVAQFFWPGLNHSVVFLGPETSEILAADDMWPCRG